MSNRLGKIITRTGDRGQTRLADGRSVSKHTPRISALGEIDELNSALGVLLCEELPEESRRQLRLIQNDLFDLGAQLSLPDATGFPQEHVERLETWAFQLNALLPPLKEFILPGGSRAAALAHLCRAICRRAERTLVQLAAAEPVPESSLVYLNRLSDLLFILSRSLNQWANYPETYWEKPEN